MGLLVKTASGLDAVWEEGGSNGKKGSAIIVTDPNGKRKLPSFRDRNPVPNGKIMLFSLNHGDYVISMIRHGQQFETTAYKYEGSETLIPIKEDISELKEALHFARLKCNSFKCKSPFFFKRPVKD